MLFQEAQFADRLQGITGSAIRQIFHLINQPGMISFAGGMPAATALKADVISELTQEILRTTGTQVLQYGATEGWAPLKESAARWLSGAGISAAPQNVLPVTGSQQGLDLVLKAYMNEGDVILVENPTFLGALQTMRTYGLNIVPVETDEMGVNMDALESAITAHKAKALYIIPTFQNPSGKTLPADRRGQVARLAGKHRLLVIEDDPYRDLRYEGEPLPAIQSFDKEGWVVYLSSFSKLVAPGLRVGLVHAEESLMKKLIIGKQSTDVHTATLPQAIVDQYLRRGLLGPHIEQICMSYKAQLDTMLAMFDQFPKEVVYTRPQGGLFVWAALPERLSAQELLEEAIARKVAYVPGVFFHCDGSHPNTLRLNFSNSSPLQIEAGMSALNETIRRAL